ncbi:MAG: cytochrome c oxidase assembly protein [Paracoccaceae bacterium]
MNGIYCGPAPAPPEIWTSFNLDPPLLAALAVLAVALRRQPQGLAGVAVLVLALVSPLCALSSALFAARVVHHVLLVAVAAPLLACALRTRAPAGGAGLPLAVSTAVLWAWHLPPAYDLALGNIPVYWVMQLSLLGSAVWFWHAVLAGPGPVVGRLGCVVAGFAQMGVLGALLTFAPEPLYAIHQTAPLAWGLAPLLDQQLGGLIMWLPAGLPYAVIAAGLARRDWRRLRAAAA